MYDARILSKVRRMAFDAADFIYESGVFRAQVVTNWPPNQRIITPPPPPFPHHHHHHFDSPHPFTPDSCDSRPEQHCNYCDCNLQFTARSNRQTLTWPRIWPASNLQFRDARKFFYGIIWEFSQMANPPFWEPLKFGSFKNKILGDFFVCFLSFEFRLKILYWICRQCVEM